MNLHDVVRDPAELHRKSVIYVPNDELTIGESTPVLLVVTDQTPFLVESKDSDQSTAWRYLLEVLTAQEVVEVWSAWRDGRIPSVQEAVKAIVWYADNDTYQPVNE